MNISGQERRQLRDALIDAFPNKSSLEQMLSFELNKKLDEIASGDNLSTIVFYLIKQSEAQNWIQELIYAARNSNSGNTSLKVIGRKLLSNHHPQHTNKKLKCFQEDLGNGITLEMVYIPGGCFHMGSPPTEKAQNEDEQPQHQVNLSAFFIGKFQVTQEQYQQIMGKNPSHFKGAKFPVDTVSWDDAVEFCKNLSLNTGRSYTLPTEAQWEYACRAGTTTPFYFGQTITTDLANYNGEYTYANRAKGNYRQQTIEVGQFPPNSFGLYDMHGNVWEWCQDFWHSNYKGAPTDGSPWIDPPNYNHSPVLRGGSWKNKPHCCRCAFRYNFYPDRIFNNIGFRVVCNIYQSTPTDLIQIIG